MDNKFFKGTANFLKREGFYVILFVCLCVVATVAVVTTKTGKKLTGNEPISKNQATSKKEVSQANSNGSDDVLYENALRVKAEDKNVITVPKDGGKSISVSKTSDLSFTKPVMGTVSVPFNVDMITLNGGRTISNGGINIVLSSENADVVAVADGVIEVASSSDKKGYRDSEMVVINHQNGLYSKYVNIKASKTIKSGMKVTKGTVIGTVDKTSDVSTSSTFGPYLHFEVIRNNVNVDPQTYVKGYVPTPTK